MPATLETLLEIPAGFTSATVARCLAEMDDQNRRQSDATLLLRHLHRARTEA